MIKIAKNREVNLYNIIKVTYGKLTVNIIINGEKQNFSFKIW